RTLMKGAMVGVAIRPESILCAPDESGLPEALANRFSGTIRNRVFKGARVSLDIGMTQGGKEDSRLRISMDPASAAAIEGPQIGLGWKADQMAILRD
ncbi:MAG: TOBE domain-containing protein, partial [Pseudomonadota bacterium]